MSPSVSAHPTETDLAAFALGKLDAAAAETVRTHLTVCRSCRTVIEHTPPDSFVELLRRRPSAGMSSPHAATPSRQTAVTRGDVPAPIPPVDAADLPAALRSHPRYRVLRQLGRGGMGIVYQAEHTVMERLVALKVVSRQLLDSPEAVERFGREVRTAAKLDHPNIVRAYDAEQADDLQLLVMEYVEGRSLSDILSKKGPLPVAHACQYIRQAALGLQHAHEKGMVHRDLKPSNLMLTPKGVVKILDFGLAKLNSERKRGAELTQKDMAMGTPEYMAPEQALDTKNADIRADIYALGCTLYCLLAGRPPFRSADGNDLQVIMAHIDQEPPPVTRFRPEVPPDLAALVARMLAKSPDERPQSPKEVADALAAVGKSGPAKTAGQTRPPEAAARTVVTGDAASSFADMTPTRRPVPTAETQSSNRRPLWLVPVLAAAGFLLVGGAVAGIIIKLRTKEGIVTVEVHPEDAKVEVAEGDLFIAPKGDTEPYRITVRSAGGKVRVSRAGFETMTRDVSVRHNGATIKVSLEPLPRAAQNLPDLETKPAAPVTPTPDAPAPTPATAPPPTITVAEGFVPLFNGKDLTGWRLEGTGTNSWAVDNETIVATGVHWNQRTFLLSLREYTDFVLRLEFSLERNGNSGVALRAHPGEVLPHGSNHALHFDHPVFKLTDGPQPEKTGSMIWVARDFGGMGNQPRELRPSGEWNQLEIRVAGRGMTASLNGQPILETSALDGELLAQRKVPGLNRVKGHVGLQNQHGVARFRNIQIKDLSAKPAEPNSEQPKVATANPDPTPAATPAEKLLAGVTQLRTVERELEGLAFAGESPEAQTRRTVKQGAILDLRGAIKAIDDGKRGKDVQWFIDRAREKIQRLELIVSPGKAVTTKAKTASQKRKETVSHAETLLNDAEKSLIDAKVLEPSSK